MMTNQVGKYKMNNALLLQNAIKEEECQEDNFIDDQARISETAIISPELQDDLVCDKIKQCDISTTLDNIKIEQSTPEVQFLKIEEGISVNDIKTEFNNGLLHCEDCQIYCEDYCTKCGMLVHILNRTVVAKAYKTSRAQLPNSILEIQYYSGESHIFAIKVIPAGVKFGPFSGLNRTEHPWKIRDGKFVINKDKPTYLNWMQYINSARNISERNLLVFQHEDNLYYQSTCQIREGTELLVYFGEEYEDSLNRNIEMDFVPASEHIFKDVFACIFCCLGFSSKSYLVKHKTICSSNADGGFSIEELMQCPTCKINMSRKEYYLHHIAYCCKINDGKCILPTTGDKSAKIKRPRGRPRKMLKCQQCGTNLEHSTGGSTNAHIKIEHLCSQGETKQFECSMCDFRTKHERSLKRHVAVKHLENCSYKCGTCDYETKYKSLLKSHIETRHLKVFKYKCYTCEYKSNNHCILKKHIETKHLKELNYNCDVCDYKTNVKFNLKIHIQRRHLKEFKYKCDLCDYKAHLISQLKSHIKTRHLNEFKYKCDRCEYKSNNGTNLMKHVRSRHLKEFTYKCEACGYKTNHKAHLTRHTNIKHA